MLSTIGRVASSTKHDKSNIHALEQMDDTNNEACNVSQVLICSPRLASYPTLGNVQRSETRDLYRAIYKKSSIYMT